MPDNKDVCDLACRTKIIINGDSISGLLGAACEAVKTLDPQQIKHGHAIIALLNAMEDQAVQVQRLVLDSVGYSGPVGKMLQ